MSRKVGCYSIEVKTPAVFLIVNIRYFICSLIDLRYTVFLSDMLQYAFTCVFVKAPKAVVRIIVTDFYGTKEGFKLPVAHMN